MVVSAKVMSANHHNYYEITRPSLTLKSKSLHDYDLNDSIASSHHGHHRQAHPEACYHCFLRCWQCIVVHCPV